MSWISNFRPKIRTLLNKSSVPENSWQSCIGCQKLIYHKILADNLYVCPHCSEHMRITPSALLKYMFDEAKYKIIDYKEPVSDPLHFKDEKKYSDRLKDYRKRTNSIDAAVVAFGKLKGIRLVLFIQNFAFMAGSMGMAVGNAMLKASEYAIQHRAALVSISAAGGARMQEGMLSLVQMPRTIIAANKLKEGGLPFISILTNPTTGGVTASYAMLGDVHIAEPNALICFAGPRVIEQTIRTKLPPGFQRAEYLLKRGIIDIVADRRTHRDLLAKLLSVLMHCPPADTSQSQPNDHGDMIGK